jgi:hypothetical protein
MPANTPPNAAEISEIIAKRLDALKDQKDSQETVSVEWRGSSISIPVISMNVDLLAYNPDTHRIRAQLSMDEAGALALESAPWGAEAQSYLHRLLMGDPADPSKPDPSFIALQEDLQEYGQNEPGIVRRDGVLINGNTRRAALKEIGQEYIRVGVLPRDAVTEDFQGIELSLQLRKDHRRDYSFMNSLLALDAQVAKGLPAVVIQKMFRIRPAVFDRHMWILSFVRDAIKRSRIKTENGVAAGLNLIDFETHKGKLDELYSAYVAAAARSPDEAKALCEQRLIAIILNKAKTDVRFVGADFVEKYMKASLPALSDTPPIKIPGTSISVAGDPANVRALQQLANSVLQAKAVQNAGLLVTLKESEAANKTIGQIESAVDKGISLAGKQDRLQQRRIAAADRITDACDDLDYAVQEVARARSVAQFDADDVDEALLSLKQSLEKLAGIVLRGGGEHSEGASWLKRVAYDLAPKRENGA